MRSQPTNGQKERTMTHDHSSAATDTPGAVLDVPGATIYYQVTGSGQVLVTIPGSRADAGVLPV
jgi:hypothetical protein